MRVALLIVLPAALLLTALAIAPTLAQPGEPLPAERFVFDSAGVPAGVRPAIVAAVNDRQPGLWPGAVGFAVGVYRALDGWGVGSLAAAGDSYPPDWGAARWFLARQAGEGARWSAVLEGSQEYARLAAEAPTELRVPTSSRGSVSTLGTQSTGDGSAGFKFPWDHLEQWYYTSAWHSGTAVDFANPWGTPGVALAASHGVLRLVCDDGQQASLRLENDALGHTAYVHLYSATVPRSLMDRPVYQGRELGRLYDGSAGSGWYTISGWPWSPCDPATSVPCDWSTRSGCCYLRYNTTCGAGTGPHLHWVLPSRSVTVDGWASRDDGCWQSESEVRCSGQFPSTNVRHTNDVATPPPPPQLTAPEEGSWSTARRVILAWAAPAGFDPLAYEVEARGEGWLLVLPWTEGTSAHIVVPGDGRYTWKVRARRDDLVGAWSDERSVQVAAAAPAAPEVRVSGPGCDGVANNVWQSTCRAPEFTWEADAGGAPLEGFLYVWSDEPDGQPSEWTPVPQFAPGEVAAVDVVASRYLNVVARDVLGHTSSRATYALRYDGARGGDGGTPDAPALPDGPAAFGVQVSAGAGYTNESVVRALAWGPGVTEMALSSDGTRPELGWLPLGPATVQLPEGGDPLATRRVYAWLRDGEGRTFGPYYDEIIYDPVPPTAHTGPSEEDGGANPVLWALDDNSGVSHVRLGRERDLADAEWVPYDGAVPAELAGSTFYAQVRDRAGNTSIVYGSDGSLFDPRAVVVVTRLPLVMRLLNVPG